MSFDYTGIVQLIEMFIVGVINTVADYVNQITGSLPNPDPFPDLIDNLVIQDDSLGSMAFWYANQFIDIGFIVTVLTAWFPMFALAWILQMLWSWAKLKNKG